MRLPSVVLMRSLANSFGVKFKHPFITACLRTFEATLLLKGKGRSFGHPGCETARACVIQFAHIETGWYLHSHPFLPLALLLLRFRHRHVRR